MSLFGALSDLAGAAVLAAAPACEIAIPPALRAEYQRFSAWLGLRTEVQDVRSVVDALGRDLWTGVETRGLAQRDLERHVVLTSDLLAEFPPGAALLAEISHVIRSPAGLYGAVGEPVARRIAADVITRAHANGDLAHKGVLEDVVAFLIERTFGHLASGQGVLLHLQPALEAYVAEEGSQSRGVSAVVAALGLSRAFSQCLEAAGGEQYLKELGHRHSLTEHAVKRLVALIDDQAHTSESYLTRLENLSHWLSDVRAQLLKPSNDDVEVRRRKSAAATALAEGDFEAAMDAMRRLRRDLREMRRRTEERLQEDALALKAQMLEEAFATGRLAEFMSARGEYGHAAELFAEAAMALPRAEKDQAWRFDLRRADALLHQARERTDEQALSEAQTVFAQLVRQAADSKDGKHLAEACLGHGDALALAGEREDGITRLQDAAAIYEKAITLIEREPNSELMVRARLAHAKVLSEMGERGRELEVLERAAQAYREAIKLTASADHGEHDASLFMGLGGTLVLIAMEARQGSVALLDEAAGAYRKALEMIDAEAEPERWAEAQFNLGLALLGLGEQSNEATHLEEAVSAFKKAIDSMPRIRVPQRWALAQMNLGNALAALGERGAPNRSHLLQAIEAYRAALEEMVRERDPLKWAITHMNLGSALIRLGELEDKRSNWLAAASSLVPALEVFEQQHADNFAEMTRRNLKRFQESWESFVGLPQEDATSGETTLQREPVRMVGNG
ncbi:MAG: hypothetical protein ACK5JT_07485 [Hyphomicrobiaceae bacterium]